MNLYYFLLLCTHFFLSILSMVHWLPVHQTRVKRYSFAIPDVQRQKKFPKNMQSFIDFYSAMQSSFNSIDCYFSILTTLRCTDFKSQNSPASNRLRNTDVDNFESEIIITLWWAVFTVEIEPWNRCLCDLQCCQN